MGGKTRTAIALMGAFAAAAALMFVVPAFGSTHEDAVRLHLGTDAQRFIYQTPDPDIIQPVAVGNKGCDLKTGLTGPLVSLGTAGGGTKVGLVDLGIGVKSGGSNGTPCSQIDSGEKLTIDNNYGRLWRALRLDLELKGNARTLVTLTRTSTGQSQTHILLTGTSIDGSGETPVPGFPYKAFTTSTDFQTACANPSDSGPDSGGNDNCLWSIQSDFDFDRVQITTSVGTASLEGSEDFGNSPDHDSLFIFNSVPTANDTTFTVNEDGSLTILPSEVGTDPEGDALLIDVLTEPTNGTATENGDGTVTYAPDPDFFGTDSFTFQVCEAANPTSCSTNTATITVNVESVNDAPVANSDEYEVNEFDTSGTLSTLVVSAPGVLANDSDPKDPGDTLSAVDLDLTGTLGAVSLQSDGSFTYTPTSGYVWPDEVFSYEDTFSYRAQDDGVPPLKSDPATVTVTVYRVICSGDEVSATDIFVRGRFQRLTDPEICKRYVLTASDVGEEIIFEPEGTQTVYYRGFLTFLDDPGATVTSGTFSIGLEYDPDGPDGSAGYQPLLACETPQFDGSGNVLPPGPGSTTVIPAGETWCIASFRGVATSGGEYVIEWQVVGEGDPGFRAG